MEFLKVENLCKVYGAGENQVIALDHVSLTIEKGEFTAIIGSSGSGKSTLLHAIAGVDTPTSGKIYLDGQDVYAGSNEKR
ncbi:ATP-binding cassette domain-containing protein, partial [Hungatella hathewayi]